MSNDTRVYYCSGLYYRLGSLLFTPSSSHSSCRYRLRDRSRVRPVVPDAIGSSRRQSTHASMHQVCVCVCTHTYTCTYICIYIYLYTHIHIYMHQASRRSQQSSRFQPGARQVSKSTAVDVGTSCCYNIIYNNVI